jgi:hypothetical protein
MLFGLAASGGIVTKTTPVAAIASETRSGGTFLAYGIVVCGTSHSSNLDPPSFLAVIFG